MFIHYKTLLAKDIFKHRYLHKNIHTYTHMLISYKERDFLNSLDIFVNLWNVLKCFSKASFNSHMIPPHSLTCFFISINKSLTCVALLIRSFLFWQYIKFVNWLKHKVFKRYIAIQIGFAINIKGKVISSILDNLLKGPKTRLYKNLHLPSWVPANQDKYLC